MITIIGKNYNNCAMSPAGFPIPESITLEVEGVERRPLWFHERNLMQTASGYGRTLKTQYVIRVDKKWHRVYVCQLSNSGTAFIKKGGKNIVVDIDDLV